jgi:O-antigen biosynthesis protein
MSVVDECTVPDNEELLRLSAAGNKLNLPFTGERVVPGAVEPQLWNEHIARYRFASLFGHGKAVLDAGCGTGYGTELLARSARYALGFDSSLDAVRYAKASYSSASYVAGSATSFPVKSASFELVTAFEIIEHLSDWELLLQEAARVLTADGVFLVSTPNTEYYADARGPSGPNPFHIHEFGLAEFDAALKRVFPFVQILAQNQQETITFSGDWNAPATSSFIPPTDKLAHAHFFLAVCGFRPLQVPFFADVANTRNLLREREIHIRGLQGELAVARAEYSELLEIYDGLANETAAGHTTGTENLPPLEAELEETRRELEALRLERSLVRGSAWIRLGRVLGIGPWSDYRSQIRALLGRYKARVRTAVHHVKRSPSALPRALRKGKDFGRQLAVYVASPFMLGATGLVLAAVDVCFAIAGKSDTTEDEAPQCNAASIVIPSWNGLSLLEANLPPLMRAIRRLPDSEVIVVDNGSTDGTAAFLKANYPEIRLVELPANEGFGSACNRGAQVARHGVVVFLNNDMEVDEAFLPGLLDKFSDPLLFAVSSQIFLTNPYSLREETGLTEVWWEGGQPGVGHRVDSSITSAFPCAYPGGGSSAFDRKKFLLLGGFDHLFHPFYYEDTDLGFLAWKRGWKVLYEPSSIVYHRHRGTIGTRFSSTYIDGVVRQNAALYCWKNLHDWKLLGGHLCSCLFRVLANGIRPTNRRSTSSVDVRHDFSKLTQVAASRWRAHSLRRVPDKEAFLRSQPGYYRDRFLPFPARSPDRLNVLFVSPYAIEPPMHGGAVFMRDTIRGLSSIANVHVISFLDREEQRRAQDDLLPYCASALFLVRPHLCLDNQWTLLPNAIREFGIRDFAWAIQRTILLNNIDVIQLEYTTMGQYGGEYQNVPCMLFEHDISSQSLWRRVRASQWTFDLLLEYLRMRLYEPRVLRRMTGIQVCSEENARYLRGLIGGQEDRIVSDVRAGIDVGKYRFKREGREPDSLLFLGTFRHLPNRDALRWFATDVLPKIIAERPQAILYVAGSDAPADAAEWKMHPSIRFLGTVPDVKDALGRFSVFVCPVLSGSGVRVKLLEAFACGMPAVSTAVGAEGLTSHSTALCEIADSPSDFARATLRLLVDKGRGDTLAENARRYVEQYRDSRYMTASLEASYRRAVERIRGSRSQSRAVTPEAAPLANQSHA